MRLPPSGMCNHSRHDTASGPSDNTSDVAEVPAI